MPTADIAARLNEIQERLAAGSRSASRDLFVAALAPVKAYILKLHPAIGADEAHDLATDAILAHLNNPQQFEPARASLWTFLCMTANSNAVDMFRKRTRQEELLRASAQDVELWATGANDGDEIDSSIDARKIMQAHGSRLATNEPERRILALLLEGEKSTEAFADALGLDPTQATTAGMVKQAKDRILLRLKRLRDEFCS